ncbi:gypsy type transposase [Tanacetum coccineum]
MSVQVLVNYKNTQRSSSLTNYWRLEFNTSNKKNDKEFERTWLFSSVQQRTNHKDFKNCLFACFLSQEEPKKVIQALKDPSWIDAMQDELLQFKLQKVWTLVDLPNGKRSIGTKWVYRNKKDERGIMIKNKARLVAQGYTLCYKMVEWALKVLKWTKNHRYMMTYSPTSGHAPDPRIVLIPRPKLVTEGVRPLRDGEEPMLESTAGRTMELVLEQPEVESTDVLAPTPLRSVPGATVEPPRLDATSVGSSEDADVAGAESEAGEVDSGLKRKRATSDDGAGTSKRVRHVSLGGSTSTEEETPDAPPTLAAKEVTETPPPNVEATSDSSAPVTHAVQSPPQTSPLTADDISRRDRETGPKAFEGMPVDQLMEEFDMVTAQQAALVAQLRARFSSERSQSVQKDEEILLLKTQLADAQAEAESSRSYAQKLAEEKMALLVKVEQERANSADYKASCHWAVKYLEGGKNNHFAGLDEFRQRVEELLEKQEEKLRKLSIEYDEELYPHMLSAIAERRWLISHGLRLAAMSALESQEVKQSFGDVVKCALARGKAEAVEELHEKKLLTVPAAQVPGYNDNAYEELVAAMETMKLLELPHIAQLERDQDYPIDVIMAGLTLARHATEGAEAQPDYFLKPDVAQLQSLRPHAIRLCLRIRGWGKAILCGVGAAHIPRSDGVPVSVATVSPKDSELLGKLKEAGDAAYQVGSSEQSRCHSI